MTGDTYDNNGCTTASGGINYGYDAENHLTNYNNGAATFVYDGNGNRVRKTVAGVTTCYLVDDHSPSGYVQVIEELTTVGSTPAYLYTYGLHLISQRQANTTTSFYGYDGNGNTRFLTGTNAAITDTCAYDAFGTLIASTGTTTNNYRYTGEQYDPNLGFYYLRARYLNPGTGRFWTRDPFGGAHANPLSLHKYLYGQADPVNRIDPLGLDGDVISLGGVVDIIGVTERFNLSTISAAKLASITRIVVIAVAVGAELGGDRGPTILHFRYDARPGLTAFGVGTDVTSRGDLSYSQALTITFQLNVNTLYMYTLFTRLGDVGFHPDGPFVGNVPQFQLVRPVSDVILRECY